MNGNYAFKVSLSLILGVFISQLIKFQLHYALCNMYTLTLDSLFITVVITHQNCHCFNIFTDDCENIRSQKDVVTSDGKIDGVTNETISYCEDTRPSVTGWYSFKRFSNDHWLFRNLCRLKLHVSQQITIDVDKLSASALLFHSLLHFVLIHRFTKCFASAPLFGI